MSQKINSMQAHLERKTAEKSAQRKADLDKQKADILRFRTGQVAPAPSLEDAYQPAPVKEHIDLRLFADMQRLKQIQSKQAKIALKAEMLPAYLPYIEGTLTVSPAPQNDVLVTLMVWALDTQDFALALQIADHALLNDMVMPAPYERTLATVFTEELAEGVIGLQTNPQAHIETIEKAIALVKSQDMPDQVRAKIYKAYGYALAADRPSDAKAAYEIALRLDPSCGVKKLIEGLQRVIKAAATASAPDTLDGSQAGDAPASTDPASTVQPVTPDTAADPAAQAAPTVVSQ